MNWHDEFDYDDGLLYWKRSLKNGSRKKGHVAGNIDASEGYVNINLKTGKVKAHRVIWEMFNGKIPDGMEIDHINHDRSDNRIDNLRMVTRSENQKNKSRFKNNTSGISGVTWCSRHCKWRARIMINGKSKHLGRFYTIEAAAKARSDAVDALGFHKNHGDRK